MKMWYWPIPARHILRPGHKDRYLAGVFPIRVKPAQKEYFMTFPDDDGEGGYHATLRIQMYEVRQHF